jgi:hypothetical protein
MSPVRLRRSRARGARLPANSTYVGRPTVWGNQWKVRPSRNGLWYVTGPDDRVPFASKLEASAYAAIRYRQWVDEMEPEQRARFLAPLRGRDLACWCDLAHACHADALLALVNPEPHQ